MNARVYKVEGVFVEELFPINTNICIIYIYIYIYIYINVWTRSGHGLLELRLGRGKYRGGN